MFQKKFFFFCKQFLFFYLWMITINSYKLKNNIKNEKEIEINNGSIAISDVTLLLPHTITQKNEVHYKLEAYNSCFKW